MFTLTIAEMARRLGLSFEGDGSCAIGGIAGVREAGPGDITFLANPKYAALAEKTKASAIIVGRDWTRPCPVAALIRADDPDKAFAQTAEFFAPPPVGFEPGVHSTAIIAPDAVLGREVSIGPFVVVESNARIGDRTVLSAGCFIGRGVSLGEDCVLYPHVSVREYCRIGHRVYLHNGAVIGSDGFGYNVDKNGVRTKIPQRGIVEIGDDVELGANVTVDRARFGRTRIGNGVKIDNLVQIAHNVVIGDHAVIVSQVGISGSSVIGKHAILAGQVGVAGHVVVGDGAILGAQAGVPNDVPPKAFVLGAPAIPKMEFARQQGYLARLPKMWSRMAELEKRLENLERKDGAGQ